VAAGALRDIRVVDLTHYLAGPYCTKLLADFGAEVVKVEPPGGEPGRWLWPFKDDIPGPERSGTFAYLNTNKRSLVLNLKRGDAREALLRLVERADLVVESFAPGTMGRLGLGYDVLRARRPGLSLVSISNFGQAGPYRDWQGSEVVLWGMGGEMYSNGIADREPLKMAGTAAILQSGSAAAVAAAAAAFGGKTGLPGQHIDVSIFESQLTGVDRRHAAIIGYQWAGRVSVRAPAAAAGGFAAGVWPCADGYVELNVVAGQFDRVRAMLGRPPELDDPAFDPPTAIADPNLSERFYSVFIPWMAERDRQTVWAEGQRAHILCAPLYTMEDVFRDPSLRERGFFHEVEREGTGRHEMPGRPFLMSQTPWELRRPAPRVGEHSLEILTELGYTPADAERFAAEAN
jgi:benzylsuccinate CoA-transferase BbsE subunit